MNMPAVAITDSSNLFEQWNFLLASKTGIQPILGARILIGEEEHHLVYWCRMRSDI